MEILDSAKIAIFTLFTIQLFFYITAHYVILKFLFFLNKSDLDINIPIFISIKIIKTILLPKINVF